MSSNDQNRSPARRGVAAIEVAMIMPILAAMLFTLVEGSNMLQTYTNLAEASHVAARQIIMTGDTAGAAELVQNLVPGLDSSALSTSVTTDASGTVITVEVSYDYSSFFSGTQDSGQDDSSLFTLVAQSSMPIP